MIKYFLVSAFITHFFCSSVANCQPDQNDKLKLEVHCYDAHYVVSYGLNAVRPSFILSIRNTSMFAVNLNQQIFFGHANDEDQNDITFELYYLTEKDTVNVLKKVFFTRSHATRNKNKLSINSTAGYFFEFDGLNYMYFNRPGKYMIRFTLLKKYAPEYMTKNISTDWVYFDVEVPEVKKSF